MSIHSHEDALVFLRRHQPMPPDPALSDELISEYEEVRQFLEANPDERAIPLLLNSFGEGSGFGIYQLVECVLVLFPPATVVPHLASSLASRQRSVRYWTAQIAAFFPDAALINPLAKLLVLGDADEHWAAAMALDSIEDVAVDRILSEALLQEKDDYVDRFILEILEKRQF